MGFGFLRSLSYFVKVGQIYVILEGLSQQMRFVTLSLLLHDGKNLIQWASLCFEVGWKQNVFFFSNISSSSDGNG